MLEASGKNQEEYLVSAQNRTRSARLESVVAGWNLFKSQLETDSALYDAQKMRAEGDRE